jgi:EpsI family protein
MTDAQHSDGREERLPIWAGLWSAGTFRVLALGALLAVSFAFCYADVLRILWVQVESNGANSYGFLIPWVSLWLLWLDRDRLRALRAQPAPWIGLLALVSSLALLLLGRLVGIVGFQEVSIILSLFGLVILLTGWAGLREMWFAVAFLFFMVPIWDFALEPMYLPLQVLAAKLGAQMLAAFGIPVLQEGRLLILPNQSVEVSYACSGINFLMSLLAIGVLLAYLLRAGVWRRLFLVAFAVAVALLANPARVAFVVYTYYSGVASPNKSHLWQGMVVSVGAFAVLFLVADWLGRKGRAEPARQPVARTAPPPTTAGRHAGVWLAVLASACLAAAGLMRPLDRPAPSLASLQLNSIPIEIGGWTAARSQAGFDPIVPAAADDELLREYRGPSGAAVQLYIGRASHLLGHPAALAYLSDKFSGIQAISIRLPSGAVIDARSAVFDQFGRGAVVVYWFQLGRLHTTSHALAKLYAAWSSVTGGPRSLLVAALADPGSAGEEPVRTVIGFLTLAAPSAQQRMAVQ